MNSNFKAIRMFVFSLMCFLFIVGATKKQTYETHVYPDVNPILARQASTGLEVQPVSIEVRYNNEDNTTDTKLKNEPWPPYKEMIKQKIHTMEADVSEKTETVNEDLPEIIGTSWSLLCIYEKGTQPKYLRNFPEYLFCKNGRWELHSLTNSMGQMGTYTVKGDQLITVDDGADKLTAKYKITWNDAEKYLELNDGKLIFRLRYRTKTKC